LAGMGKSGPVVPPTVVLRAVAAAIVTQNPTPGIQVCAGMSVRRGRQFTVGGGACIRAVQKAREGGVCGEQVEGLW